MMPEVMFGRMSNINLVRRVHLYDSAVLGRILIMKTNKISTKKDQLFFKRIGCSVQKFEFNDLLYSLMHITVLERYL